MRRFLLFTRKPVSRRTLTGAVAAALVVTAYLLSGPSGQSQEFKPVRVVPPFKPITEFPVKSVAEAKDALNPSELVLGVTVGKESRAYPINMLVGPQREILNDNLGGKAIAATW